RPRVQKGRPRARGRLLRLHDPALLDQAVRKTFVLGRRVRPELLVVLQDPRDLVARDRDARHLSGLDLRHEGAEADGLIAPLEAGGEIPHEDPHHDEHHPEQQALQGRVHSGPPNGSKLKTTTDLVAGFTANSSASACPATQTIRPSGAVTTGTRRRSSCGTRRSTNRSWTFLRPGAPSGRNRSPGSHARTTTSGPSAGAATATPQGPSASGRATAAASAGRAANRSPASGTSTAPGIGT